MVQKAGEKGVALKVERKTREPVSERKKQAIKPDPADFEKKASVGISLNVGMSTEFAREKIDISMWMTIPAHDSEEGRAEAVEQIVHEIMPQLKRRLDDAVDYYFPELGSEASDED